jgi:Ni/Fe-hydrogenase subunit HybB-like protein
MKQRVNMLQTISGAIGKICFLLSVLCAVALYLKVKELGMQHPVSASFLASSFFFLFVGFVLTVIAKTDLPSFKVTSASRDEESK